MKFSLSGFKKISKDGDTTTLKHPDGHEMTINHSILSPKMRGEIEALPKHESEEKPHYDDGGDVTPEKEVEDSYNKFAGTIKPQPKPLTRDEKYDAIRKRNTSNASGSTSTLDQPVYADGGKVKAGGKESESTESQDLSKVEDRSNEGLKLPSDIALPKEETDAEKSAESVPDQIDEATKDVPGVSEESPKPYNPAQSMSEAHNNAMEAHNNAIKLFAASQGQQSQAASVPQQPVTQDQAQTRPQPEPQAQAQQPADSQVQPRDQSAAPPTQPGGFDDLQNQVQNKINDLHSYVADQEAKNQSMAQAVMQDKIDPNRLYKNSTTGENIMRAIGLALGGIGGGATGGKNLAVDAINHAIERDVDAQKANQSNEMNLYKTNLEATHNDVEARNLTINQLLASAQGQLAKAGLQNQSATTQANVAKVGQEIQQLRLGNAQNSFLLKQLQGGEGSSGTSGNTEEAFQNKMNTLRMLKPDYAKDLESKYIPGVGIASVPIPETARTEMIDRANLSKKLAALENFSAKYGGLNIEGMSPAIKNQGRALAADAQNAYRSANKQGVFKESESKFVNKIIHDDPSTLFSSIAAEPGYKQTRDSNNTTLDSMRKGYGMKQFTSNKPSIQTMNGIPYQLGPDGQYHRVR